MYIDPAGVTVFSNCLPAPLQLVVSQGRITSRQYRLSLRTGKATKEHAVVWVENELGSRTGVPLSDVLLACFLKEVLVLRDAVFAVDEAGKGMLAIFAVPNMSSRCDV